MSTGTAVLPGSTPSGSAFPPGEPESESLDWLLAALHDTIAEVQASDASALQKASAIARLGNLYMKARRTAALECSVKELKQRVADLEQRIPACEWAAADARPAESEMRAASSIPDPNPQAEPDESPAEPHPVPPAEILLSLPSDESLEIAHRPGISAAGAGSAESTPPYAGGHP